jgi:hypothetical protein
MASVSPAFILDDAEKNKSTSHAHKTAFHVSLFSAISGSIHPLLMTDTKDAKTRPVVFEGPGNS